MAKVGLEVSRQLAEAGLPSELINYGTGHNPVRVSDSIGCVQIPPGAQLRVVGFDWSVFDDPRFERAMIHDSLPFSVHGTIR
jgi:hypothetical protein